VGLFSHKINVKKLERRKDIPVLLEALNHKDINVQREAARALGRIGGPKCVNELIKLLKTPGFQRVSKIVLLGDIAWALGEIRDKRAIKPLKELQEIKLGMGIGGGSFEEMMKQAAEAKKNVEFVKGKAREALEKIG